MATTSYTIINSQGNLRFQINVGSASGPYEQHQQDADLTFYGYGRTGWGQEVDQNFYRLLENFAVMEKTASPATPKSRLDLSPSGGLGINKPILGQSWFNLTTSEMYVCDDPTLNSWRHLISEQYADSHYLGSSTASTFVQKIGDIMTGYLTLNADPRAGHPLDAATKGYVDTSISDAAADAAANSTFVKKVGDTMTGALKVTTSTPNDAFLNMWIEGSGSSKYPEIQMGKFTGPSSAAFEFWTSGSSVMFDSAIVASGGTPGVAGNGIIAISGNIVDDGRTPIYPNQLVHKSWVEAAITTAITNLNSGIGAYYATYDFVNSHAYMPAGWGGQHQVWVSWDGPSGGADGDIWFQL
jgi:hypothetical protein